MDIIPEKDSGSEISETLSQTSYASLDLVPAGTRDRASHAASEASSITFPPVTFDDSYGTELANFMNFRGNDDQVLAEKMNKRFGPNS